MSDRDDLELRSRFADIRSADETAAPDFHGVLESASRRPPDRMRLGWRSPSRVAVSLAAAAAIVLAIGLTIQSRQRRAFVPVSLSIWTSPTASLLRTPGSELTASSTFAPSMIEPATSKMPSRTGAKK